jgi:hypothetical protein
MDPLSTLIVASVLDPIRALITAAFGAFAHRAIGISLAAAASAIVCETILTSAHVWHFWGQGIVAGFIACLLQAIAIHWAMEMVRRRRFASER